MSELFLKFLNISITAGWLVLGILLIRILLRKTPKWLNCMMWGLVGLRLIFPFSIESVFSLIPSKETVSEEILYTENPTIQSGSTIVDERLHGFCICIWGISSTYLYFVLYQRGANRVCDCT